MKTPVKRKMKLKLHPFITSGASDSIRYWKSRCQANVIPSRIFTSLGENARNGEQLNLGNRGTNRLFQRNNESGARISFIDIKVDIQKCANVPVKSDL